MYAVEIATGLSSKDQLIRDKPTDSSINLYFNVAGSEVEYDVYNNCFILQVVTWGK